MRKRCVRASLLGAAWGCCALWVSVQSAGVFSVREGDDAGVEIYARGRQMKVYLLLVFVLLYGCSFAPESGNKYGEPILASKAICHWRMEPTGYLPDANCSSGAVFANVTKEMVCKSGYSASVRDVSGTLKEQVYANYGILTRQKGEYEVDHIVPLSISGSNDIQNLWPQPAEPRPNFREKDRYENILHRKVCAGEMTLAEAQYIMATNWTWASRYE